MTKKIEIGLFVKKKIGQIQAVADYGAGKKTLAQLRRGIGHEPGSLPELFAITLQDLPEGFLSKDGDATKEEWASYLSLTLYALHQQGYNAQTQPMHTKEGGSLGSAMSSLVSSYEGDPNAEERILQRLQTLATSIDMKALSHHLRSVVQLLKSKGIPLDYGRLAGDLYEMQFPEGKKRVCLRWGEDLYRRGHDEEQKEDAP